MDTSASEFLIYDIHHSRSNPENSNEVNFDHVWDTSWTIDQVREHSQSWTLGGDSGLLNRLQEIAQSLVSQTHLIQKEVNKLSHETEVTSAVLNNVNNDFLMLSNCQFVENRVYDEEVSNNDTTLEAEKKDNSLNKNKEEKETEIISKVSFALKLGISVINEAYEHLQVQDSDSEDEEESYHHEPILHPKDRYANRPLPYIIGSERFNSDNKLGIVENLSEDELPDDVSIHSSKISDDACENNYHSSSEKNGILDDAESGIENGHYISQIDFREETQNEDIFSPDNEDKDSLTDNDNFFTSTLKNNFDKELASKLRTPQFGSNLSSSTDANVRGSADHAGVQSKIEKSTSGNLPISANIPKEKTLDNIPAKAFESDDDDDLFDNDGLFSSNRKSGLSRSKELLNSGSKIRISDNVESTQNQENLFSNSDDDDDLFATSIAKKPVKTKPLFDQKDEADSDDDFNNMKLPVGAKSMFGIGGNKINQQILQSVKSSEIENKEIDNDGSEISRSTSSISFRDAKKDSPLSASNSGQLADDNDIDDLFGTPTVFNSKPKGHSNMSLFSDVGDDDLEDIFAPIGKSNFVDSDNFVADIKSQSDKQSANILEVSPFNNDSPGDNLFIRHDSLKKSSNEFSSESKASLTDNYNTTFAELENEDTQAKRPLAKKALFHDDEEDFEYDLFKSQPRKNVKSTIKNMPNETKTTKKTLFDDKDDDDFLFGPSSSGNADVTLFGSVSTETSKMKDEKQQTIPNKNPEVNSSATHLADDVSLKVAMKLEEHNDSGLFVVSAEMEKSSQQLAKVRRPATGDKISKLRSDIAEKHESAASNASSNTLKKKPVGGVSMFGGVVPSLVKPQRSHSPAEINETESASNSTVSDERSPSTSHIGSPLLTKSTDGSTKEESISFDCPVEPQLLPSANKDRAKIKVKRRPQTRKARHETIRNSAVDIDSESVDKLSASEQKISSISAPTSPFSPGPDSPLNLPSVSLKSDKLTIESEKCLALLSPSTDEEDLFIVDSRQPCIPPLNKGVKIQKAKVSNIKRRSSAEDLFGDNSDDAENGELFTSKSTKAKIIPQNNETITHVAGEHTVGEINPSKPVKLTLGNGDADDELFGEFTKSNAAIKAQPSLSNTKGLLNTGKDTQTIDPKHKASKSLFDDDDDDEDLFKTGNSNISKSKAVIANAKPPSTMAKSLFDDEEDDNDLFADPLKANKK